VHEDVKRCIAWMLLLEAGCIGSFLALDLFMFFLFFELTLVPMYFLIGGWGYANRVYASLKFFIYTLVGSAFLLVGILALVSLVPRDSGRLTFDFEFLADHLTVAASTAKWL